MLGYNAGTVWAYTAKFVFLSPPLEAKSHPQWTTRGWLYIRKTTNLPANLPANLPVRISIELNLLAIEFPFKSRG